MAKIDWKKRRLFCEIQNKPDTELMDIYEGSITVVETYQGKMVPFEYNVFVVPVKTIVGRPLGDEGYVYMINRTAEVGFTPSKVYTSLQACLGAAQSDLLKYVESVTPYFEKSDNFAP